MTATDSAGERSVNKDNRITFALIGTVITQTIAVVWWAASITAQVEELKRANPQDRLARVETKIDVQGQYLTRIDARLDQIQDRKRSDR